MKNLFMKLPAFSPDYSGVAAALFELGGLVVIHDGTGCTGNYLCHDEPRGPGSNSAVFTSNLREIDVVMGGDEAFLEKVCNAARDLAPNFIALLNSPAPLVMGTDFAALSRIIERETGIPTLFFNTNGMAFYDKGLADAWLALAKRFAGNQAWETPPAVNILGAVPLDLGPVGQLADLAGLLANMGYGPIFSFGMDGRFDQLGSASTAKLNLVIHVSGIKAAQYCKQEFGVPYVVHMPIGESGITLLQSKISHAFAAIPQQEALLCRDSARNGKRALVIHEQITANGWRDCLQSEFGFQNVTVASFFSMEKAYMQTDDIRLLEETDLQKIAKAYDYLFCDRILFEAAENPKAILVEIPHLAVSGCYHWNESFRSIGSKGTEYLRAQLSPK